MSKVTSNFVVFYSIILGVLDSVFFSILGQNINFVGPSVIEIFMFTFVYFILCR